MVKIFLLLLQFCLLTFISFSQADTIDLSTIDIESSLIAIEKEPGENKLSGDHSFPLVSPIDLLNQSGEVYINRQGITGIASQNLRNVGFSRSLVSWNGIPINSPRNGGLDYQLLSPSLQNITLYDGGRSGKTSSGAIGGELALRSEERWRKGFHGGTGIAIGSYDHWVGKLKASFANDKYKGSIKSNYKFANNDFKYKNGNSTFNRTNSKIEGLNIHQDNNWKINAKNIVKTNVWWQQFEREIPQGINATYRDDVQSDKNIRLGLTHLLSTKKGVFKTTTGYLQESITYQNDLIPAVPGIAQRLFIESKYHHFSSENLNYIIGLSTTQDGTEQLFSGQTNYNQSSALGTVHYKTNDSKISLTLRQSFIDAINHPLTGNLIWEFKAGRKIWAYLKFGREYRFPSINDSYWQGPGGINNPDLKAEKSWLQEWNWEWKKYNSFTENGSSIRFTFFSMFVDNWIQWIQTENQLWQPQNLKKVWSRGIKIRAKTTKKIRNHHFLKAQINYQYNPSTNIAVFANQGSIKNKQLPRSPKHHAMASLAYQSNFFNLKYSHHFTGSRFENPKNTIENNAFNIGDIVLTFRLNKSKSTTTIGFHLNNIFNRQYEIIPNYPMPGTNFRFLANFDF